MLRSVVLDIVLQVPRNMGTPLTPKKWVETRARNNARPIVPPPRASIWLSDSPRGSELLTPL
jgi:hypothetical protein